MVALIGLPVGGAVGTAAMLRTTTRTVADERAANFGRADDVVSTDGSTGPTPAEQVRAIREAYPAGSRLVIFDHGPDALEDDDGHLHDVQVSDRPWGEPLLDGTANLLRGRAPERSGEAVLNEAALDAIGAQVGDEAELFLLGRVEIVGEFRDETTTGPQAVTADPPAAHPSRWMRAFVDVPAGQTARPDVQALGEIGVYNYAGADGEPFQYVRDEVRNRVATTYVVVGVVLVVTAIVASAAFALGARRQLRTLGLLSASGAPPAAMRRAVLLQGTVTGAVASVLGAALGLAGAAAAHPWLADRMDRTLPPLRIHPLDLVVPIALGVLAATAAAWLPALSASRVPVLAALAERRPTGRVPVALPLAGGGAAAAGITVLALWTRLDDPPWGVAVAAALVVLLGGTAVAPWIVSHTEPLARRLRGGARVAARGLARNRLRSGAVVAAVMAPAGLSIFAASAALTDDARQQAVQTDSGEPLADDEVRVVHFGAPPDEARRVVSDVRRAVPGADEFTILVATHSQATEPLVSAVASLEVTDPATVELGGGTSSRYLVVASPAGLRDLGVPRETVDALEAGKIVVFDLVGPDASVSLTGLARPLDRSDIVADPMTRVPSRYPTAYISPETAESWGLAPIEYGTLFRAPSDLTDAQVQAIRSATDGDPDDGLRQYLLDPNTTATDVYADIGREYHPSIESNAAPLTWAAVGASLLFTLLVVAIALALDASESADERALLSAIGAPPAVRRSIVAWQAFLLPALAALVAVPVGLVVSYAVLSNDDGWSGPAQDVAVQVPWGAMALLLLAVPLATAGCTWVGAALRGRRRRDMAALSLGGD
jgi:putative ABC transport system permease protein